MAWCGTEFRMEWSESRRIVGRQYHQSGMARRRYLTSRSPACLYEKNLGRDWPLLKYICWGGAKCAL